LAAIASITEELLLKMKMINLFKLFVISILLFSEIISAQKAPKDFEIYFTFGFHKDETVFDSRNSTLIVQGIDTLMTFKFKLSAEEKQTIYEELLKINFFDYPEKYSYQHSDTEEVFIDRPCQHYFLTVKNKNSSKNVEWDNCMQSRSKDEKHVALMDLDRTIEKIIWARQPLKDYHSSKMSDPD